MRVAVAIGAALVAMFAALSLFALAGFEVGRFFDVLQLPIAWGIVGLALIALAVLTRTDLIARIMAKGGLSVTIDTPPGGEEEDHVRD